VDAFVRILFMTTHQLIEAIEEANRTWKPLSLPVRNKIAKRLDEFDRETARLRDALNEARQYVEAYVLNVDAPGGVTGGESLLTKIDDIFANASDHRCSPEASATNTER
jgi:hypothetical protein